MYVLFNLMKIKLQLGPTLKKKNLSINTWWTGHTFCAFLSCLPTSLTRPAVPHFVHGRTIRDKFPDFPIHPVFHAKVSRGTAVEFLVEVVLSIAN